MYCMFTLPLIDITKTLKYKCTRHMPLPMILSGSLVGFCWFLHGIVINSGIVIVMSIRNSRQISSNLTFSRFLIFRLRTSSCSVLISFNCRCLWSIHQSPLPSLKRQSQRRRRKNNSDNFCLVDNEMEGFGAAFCPPRVPRVWAGRINVHWL